MKHLSILGLASLLLLSCAGAVLAHGDMTHIMGTIEKADGAKLVIVTSDRVTTSVILNAKTKYNAMKEVGSREDIKAGLRVVVEAKEEQGVLTAHEVTYGASGGHMAMHDDDGHDHDHDADSDSGDDHSDDHHQTDHEHGGSHAHD